MRIRAWIVGVLPSAAHRLQAAWSPIRQFFAGLWHAIEGAFSRTCMRIRAWIVGVLPSAAHRLQAAWSPIRQFFVALWQGIESAFEGAWAYIKPIIDKIAGAARMISEIHLPNLGIGQAMSDATSFLGDNKLTRAVGLSGDDAGAAKGAEIGAAFGKPLALGAPQQPVFGPGGSAGGPPGATRADVGGTLNVKVTTDPGARAEVSGRPNSSDMNYDINTGHVMAGAGMW
jgi:hypothetical protein